MSRAALHAPEPSQFVFLSLFCCNVWFNLKDSLDHILLSGIATFIRIILWPVTAKATLSSPCLKTLLPAPWIHVKLTVLTVERSE